MSILRRDGVDLYYEVHGTGPVLLLTHGFSATTQMWRGQIDALAKAFTLVLWDMRGHGRSASPADPDAYSETATVADMAALLDELDAPSAIVGGLSLGGYMSLAFYRALPQRVRALIVVDTGPGFKNPEAREGWNRVARQRAEAFEQNGLAALEGASSEVSASQHRSAAGLAHAARGMLTQRDASVMEVLPEVAVPALVLAGADDTPFLAATDYMAHKVPGAQKVIVPAAGHAVNIDQPALFNAAVLAFLETMGSAEGAGN